MEAAEGKPILSLFKLPLKGKGIDSASEARLNKVSMKTELIFIERCLDLLVPGGRLGIVLPEGIFNNPSLQYVREFTENRAFLRAVISLPQETFVSSGASVKCSILFLQKFTAEERECFDRTQREATEEITRKYQSEVEQAHARLEHALAKARADKSKDQLTELRKERKDFDRHMADTIAAESRALLKSRRDYPVFLYEAEKVGISATGEPDQNELFPNDRLPPGVEKSCLELYREFQHDPAPFFVHGPTA